MFNKPFIARKADRPAFWVMGDTYTLMASAAETGGQFSLFEFSVPAGMGSPPHVHTIEDETFYVLSGTVEFTIDGIVSTVGPGEVVYGSRNVPHNFRNVGSSEARMLVLATPGGLEEFFAAAGTPAESGGVTAPAPTHQDKERLLGVAPQFGIEILVNHD